MIKNKYKFLLFILFLFLLVNSNIITFIARAETYTSWIVKKSTPNEYLYIDRIDEDKIIMYGEHNKASNELRYGTAGFLITKDLYETKNYFPTKWKKDGILPTQIKDTLKPDGKTIRTKYTIDFLSFMEAVTSLGINGETIGNGSLTVYLQFIFNTYKGDVTTAENIIGYQEMLEAPIKYKLGFSEWSARTQEILESYYNLPFLITSKCSYNLKVIAVDTKGNEIKKDLIPMKKAIYSEKLEFDLNNYKTLKLSSGTYKINNKYRYEYTKRNTTTNIKSNKTSFGNYKFNFKAPDASIGSTLTVYVEYDIEPYYYNVVAIDKNKNALGVLQGKEETFSGKTVKFDMSSYTKYKDFNYQNKWYLKYTDIDGNIKETAITNTKNISYVMPAGKKDSLATFYVMYDKNVTTPPPTPTPGGPTPTKGPTPTPFIPPVVAPEPKVEHMAFTEVKVDGMIKADNRGSERFHSTLGVPTTESLYGQVRASDYLLGYKFVKKTGIKHYVVEVKKDYILNWFSATPDSAGGSKPVTEKVTITQKVTVPRAYGYWVIQNLECYKIENATLKNYALPNEAITIYPNTNHYNPPNITYLHSPNEDDHIIPPKEVKEGIVLPTETITGDTRKPVIRPEDFSYYALSQTSKIKVKSDLLMFNGNTIISNAITEINAPDAEINLMPQCFSVTNENVLYKPNQLIQATKINGTYRSTGTLTYTSVASVYSNKPSNLVYMINNINDVTIHTPVVCNPKITSNNDKYVQLINPNINYVQLVLDPDPNLSDFTVTISNNGEHVSKQGYFTRDFSRSLRDPNVSYIAMKDGLLRNEVQFPFDVYIDIGKDNNQSNDDYIKAGTWITIGRSSPRFYLPMWTKEGTYSVKFRTVAVNGQPYINKTEEFANTNLINYVATEIINVEVSGRIYGLTMYDISDYPLWKDIFRIPNSYDFKKDSAKYPDGTDRATYNKSNSYTYKVGTSDQYGNDTRRNIKYTFPLVDGSHPQYSNIGILKTGYITRFSLETTGNMYSNASKIIIKPTFYYVDKDGKNRTAVDLYYTEEINGKNRHLVKMGSALDKTNVKHQSTGDIYLGIPESELRQTAKIREITYGKIIAQRNPIFNFLSINLNYGFRTFVNEEYTSKIKSLPSYQDVVKAGVKENDITQLKQRWYGEYYIPNEIHAVAKGFDVMDYADKHGVDYTERFWLKEGYIIVNFNIYTISDDEKQRLSYINASNYKNYDHCSMWVMENPPTEKKSYKGPTFKFYAGDYVIYYANKRMSSDYKSGAIY